LKGIKPKKNNRSVIHNATLIEYKSFVIIDTNPFTIHINNRNDIAGLVNHIIHISIGVDIGVGIACIIPITLS
jgi:hypothetical protein